MEVSMDRARSGVECVMEGAGMWMEREEKGG